ncbi:MAG: SDR family oxidoreductase [Rhodospirillaceae bacterium]|jgi:3-oxoacyl-[acyl-carrier protein] reductase|nr:SDR family oxidoreductase [Rhodospirillaceae bacterium]MBT4907256.1 SDR family oxidoreductase [Rhodospirillaceae bacterium]MBT5356890.1 SDR family oxidoreductase [Rhodospirillaceae bacterium]MBT6311370.1 SDR family oxidoreductase [Rhodospirillaceae bacterium]
MRLQDKTAFITGASKGLGRAIAERFVEEGARVVIADIDQENLDKTLAETTVDASRLTAINLDVSDFDAVQAAINGAIADFGALDILVNNAGFSPKKNWLEYEISEWQKVLDVNLSGEFFGARAVAEHMMERRSGRIINMSSSSWRHGGVASGGGMPYVSSKAGVIGLTRSLSKTLGPYNITVNAIAPGPTHTPMTESWLPQTEEALLEHIPLRRLGTPRDIANAALFLASDEAAFITGSCLDVNGGLTMS